MQGADGLLAAEVEDDTVSVHETSGGGILVRCLQRLFLAYVHESEGMAAEVFHTTAERHVCRFSRIVCLNVVDGGAGTRIIDAYAQLGGLHGLEAQQTLVADGGGFLVQLDGQPSAVLVIFHGEGLHTLSQGDVLLQHHAVHLCGLRQAELNGGSEHAVVGSPIGVVLAVGDSLGTESSATLVADGGDNLLQQVVRQLLIDVLAEVYGVGAVNGMHKSVAVNGKVEQQGGVVTHGTVVEVGELLHGLHMSVLFRMVEPTRANADVTFGRHPLVAIGMTVLQDVVLAVSGIDLSGTEERPIGGTGKAAFVAHPTATGTAIGEDDSLWLQFVQHLVNLGIVIIVLAVNGAAVLGSAIPSVATVGSVEPNLKDLAIVGHQFVQLCVEIVHIGGCGIFGVVAVPRTQVDSELDAIFLTGCRQFAHHIALSVLIGRVADAVFRKLCGPQAESVMMLGGKDYALHTGCHKGLHPLLAVQLGGVERGRVGVAITPLAVVEGVQSEMHKGIGLHLLPLHLFRFGNGKNGFGSLYRRLACRKQRCCRGKE